MHFYTRLPIDVTVLDITSHENGRRYQSPTLDRYYRNQLKPSRSVGEVVSSLKILEPKCNHALSDDRLIRWLSQEVS